MAKSRKKKKTQTPSPKRDYEVTKTYFDKFSEVARKTLRLLDLDPALYDKFTKKQKINMMLLKYAPPHVYAQKGHSIPSVYLKVIQQEIYNYSKSICVDPKVPDLLYCDYFTYSMTFLTNMRVKEEFYADTELGPICSEIVKRYSITMDNFEKSFLTKFYQYIKLITIFISKINFRYYGFKFEYKSLNDSLRYAGHVYVNSTQAPRINFSYKQTTRPAYQLAMGQFLDDIPNWLYIPYKSVYPDNEKSTNLSVYAQNHVMIRMKERLDNQPYYYQSFAIINSALNKEIITKSNLLVCRDQDEQLIGYFPFIVQEDKLILLTFLPLSSPNVPEGKMLHREINFEKQDLSFLNMDKLSFYRQTDFEAIPQLKMALIKSGIWHLTEIVPQLSYKEENKEKSVGIITRFFQQKNEMTEI